MVDVVKLKEEIIELAEDAIARLDYAEHTIEGIYHYYPDAGAEGAKLAYKAMEYIDEAVCCIEELISAYFDEEEATGGEVTTMPITAETTMVDVRNFLNKHKRK